MAAPIDIGASIATSSGAQGGNIGPVTGGGSAIKGWVLIMLAALAVVALWVWRRK